MANHKSAIKRMRQNEKRRARNRSVRSQLRTELKKIRGLAHEGEKEEARKVLPATTGLIDKILKRGVIHENKAARLKSRLTRLVNSPASK